MTTYAPAVLALVRREIVRFWRERTRVVGAVLQPLIFWAFFGGGLAASFRLPGGGPGYGAWLFPGTVVLVLLFTAIFSTISVIEDRREGFLQGALVAPVPRAVIVLGKVLGGTTLAALQAGAILLAGPLVGVRAGPGDLAWGLALVVIIGFALTSLSFAIAWRMRSTQGFHAIMTIFLMPLWLLSGAFFPAAGAPPWLGWLMTINPLTYGVAALRHALGPAAGGGTGGGLPAPGPALALTLCFMVVAFAAALLVARCADGAAPA